MTDDKETRRRRALYRAGHRGTKEMDWLVGRYADAHVAGMSPETLTRFEQFLALPDPDLQTLILEGGAHPTNDFYELILALRRFHGLEPGL